jgi:hypothetical protein
VPRKRPALLGPDPCEYLGDKTSAMLHVNSKKLQPVMGIGMALDMGLATASVTLERFCDELSRQSGYKVVAAAMARSISGCATFSAAAWGLR